MPADAVASVDQREPEDIAVQVPWRLDALLPPGAAEYLRERHDGLACDPELEFFLDRRGRFLRPNPYLGSCHDAQE